MSVYATWWSERRGRRKSLRIKETQMSSLESMLAAGEEAQLLSGLDFTLPPSSTAIVDLRQRIKAYPTSASSLSPTSTKTVRIRLGGDDFCSTESVRIQYTITNKHASDPLTPLCGPWGM